MIISDSDVFVVGAAGFAGVSEWFQATAFARPAQG